MFVHDGYKYILTSITDLFDFTLILFCDFVSFLVNYDQWKAASVFIL
jgi:hypothetical protein